MNAPPRRSIRSFMRAAAAAARRAVRTLCWWWLRRGLHEIPESELREDAWAIIPHPDDECLGCGGFLLRKAALGARVRVVFLGDGSSSHSDRIDPAELARRRLEEARASCARLGVRPRDVHFVLLDDSEMVAHVAEGSRHLASLLASDPTSQVIMPYAGEPHPDHRAVWEMARAALDGSGAGVTVFEYPVWFWDAFPWMGDAANGSWRAFPRRMAAFPGHFSRLLRDFHASISVASVLDDKREALACHATQMERPADDPGWATLGDVSYGEFLGCCLGDVEVFHRYVHEPTSRADRSVHVGS